MKTVLVLVAALMGILQAGSDAGYVDLTQGDDTSPSAHADGKSVSDGCNQFSGGTLADGERASESVRNKPKLLVEFSRPPAESLAIGQAVDAEVRMTNTGNKPIEIPWSTDLAVVPKNQDPAQATWSVGTFWFFLDGRGDHRLLLASTSRRLYGTKASAGSEITIPAGQSVRARVSFKVDSLYTEDSERLKDGKWTLSAEWQQVEVSASLQECRQFTGYLGGPSFYFDEKNPSIAVSIASNAPNPGLR
jgi:hypothetical protein